VVGSIPGLGLTMTQINSVIARSTSCACHCGIFCRDIDHVPGLCAAKSNLISLTHMHKHLTSAGYLFNQHTNDKWP
jgi:hypothetical protein